MPQLTVSALYSLTQKIKQKIDDQIKSVSDSVLTAEQKVKLVNFNKWQEKAGSAITPHICGVEVDYKKIEAIKTDISSTYPDSDFNVGTSILDFIRLTINDIKSSIHEAVCASQELRELNTDLTQANSYLHSSGEYSDIIQEDSGLIGLLNKYSSLDQD